MLPLADCLHVTLGKKYRRTMRSSSKVIKRICGVAAMLLLIAMPSCVGVSQNKKSPIAPVDVKQGRIERLSVGDELAGWGLRASFDYRLVRLDGEVASFQASGGQREVKEVRVGDYLKIRTFNGIKHVEVREVTKLDVRVFIPELPWIIDPPNLPKPMDCVPTAKMVPGRPGMVFSPYTGEIVDVADCVVGTRALDPTTSTNSNEMKPFRVPAWGE